MTATRCVIAGGGPAGMMLGFLLARAGIDVTVLEKHADFFRDFRGDTIHPSTLQLMHELGLLDAFLAQPHNEVRQVRAQIGDTLMTIADVSHVPTVAKFVALMPQWDFLNFLDENARRYPSFHLLMETSATGLIVEDGVSARRAHRERTTAPAKFAPTWSWARTAARRSCARRRNFRCRRSARRWTFSGCVYRAAKATPNKCWDASTSAR